MRLAYWWYTRKSNSRRARWKVDSIKQENMYRSKERRHFLRTRSRSTERRPSMTHLRTMATHHHLLSLQPNHRQEGIFNFLTRARSCLSAKRRNRRQNHHGAHLLSLKSTTASFTTSFPFHSHELICRY
jgi:hypothetical protein